MNSVKKKRLVYVTVAIAIVMVLLGVSEWFAPPTASRASALSGQDSRNPVDPRMPRAASAITPIQKLPVPESRSHTTDSRAKRLDVTTLVHIHGIAYTKVFEKRYPIADVELSFRVTSDGVSLDAGTALTADDGSYSIQLRCDSTSYVEAQVVDTCWKWYSPLDSPVAVGDLNLASNVKLDFWINACVSLAIDITGLGESDAVELVFLRGSSKGPLSELSRVIGRYAVDSSGKQEIKVGSVSSSGYVLILGGDIALDAEWFDTKEIDRCTVSLRVDAAAVTSSIWEASVLLVDDIGAPLAGERVLCVPESLVEPLGQGLSMLVKNRLYATVGPSPAIAWVARTDENGRFVVRGTDQPVHLLDDQRQPLRTLYGPKLENVVINRENAYSPLVVQAPPR